MLFTSDGTFVVPENVSSVRVIAIGGGGGGSSGPKPGGAGGYLECGTFAVTCGEKIQVAVGTGGRGGVENLLTKVNENVVTNGRPSLFGTFLTASNPRDCSSARASRLSGCAGGTGSGACCWPDNQPQNSCPDNTYGGYGGTGGSGGGGNAINNPGGAGQGTDTYSKCLSLAVYHSLTAGEGGYGGYGFSGYYGFAAGGGGGGVLIDGYEPQQSVGNG